MKRTLYTIYLWVYIFFDFVSILLILTPLSIILSPFDKTQKLTSKIMLKMGASLIQVMPEWKVKVFGTELYDGKDARVFVCNHQSFLDMPLQASLPYNFKWVSKVELFSVPIMGWFMRLTKQLSINRGKSSAKDLLNQAIPLLENGISISIFPEGTRTRNKELLPFKKGAFLLAKEAGVKIQPMVIDGTFNLNQPDDWRFNDKGEIQLHILESIDPNDFNSVDELMNVTFLMIKDHLDEIRSKSFENAESTMLQA
jgi:1-acyl-sn-glycerol-3-phosphate acyltransferase